MPPLAYSQSRNQYAPVAEQKDHTLSWTQSQFPKNQTSDFASAPLPNFLQNLVRQRTMRAVFACLNQCVEYVGMVGQFISLENNEFASTRDDRWIPFKC